MSIAQDNFRRTVTFCIDSCESGVIVGRVYSSRDDGVRHFKGLMQLLLSIQNCMEEEKFPQSFLQMREFTPRRGVEGNMPDVSYENNGSIATFNVRVLYRQNASWQGSVDWVEGNTQSGFRSALELIFLMNSTLINEKTQENALEAAQNF